MIHFTMTGYYAGKSYCNQEKNETDTYYHPAYNEDQNNALMNKPNFCPICKQVYLSIMNED